MKHPVPLTVGAATLALSLTTLLAQDSPAPAPPDPIAVSGEVADPAAPAPPQRPAPPLALLAQLATEKVLATAADEPATTGVALGRGAKSGRALVIPAGPPDPKNLAENEEDLSVMARILDKAAGRKSDARHSLEAMGLYLHSTPFGGSATPRSLYLDGYGAVFFLNVGFPLVPPAKEREETKPKESASTEWEDARRELSGTRSSFEQQIIAGVYKLTGSDSSEPYSAEKVDDLKRGLLEALKNATYIRTLKPNESVTVVVTGGSPSASKVVKRRATSGSSSGVTITQESTPGPAGKRAETTLIVRAKKSDAEAFEKGSLDFEAFKKKATVLVY